MNSCIATVQLEVKEYELAVKKNVWINKVKRNPEEIYMILFYSSIKFMKGVTLEILSPLVAKLNKKKNYVLSCKVRYIFGCSFATKEKIKKEVEKNLKYYNNSGFVQLELTRFNITKEERKKGDLKINNVSYINLPF